jgi:glycosyltransferase involved in cell wall biosynthesis
MHHSIPIFTSDIDFATDVCGDAAFYFNPLSADLILETICYAFADNSKISEKVSKGKNQLKNQLNWEQVFEKYQYFLQELKQS